MDRLYVFIIRNDVWIYILCSVGFIWYAAELIRARRLLRSAMFGLERERGQRMQSRALILIFVFAALAAFVTFVNLQIAPDLPEELLKPPTPTPGSVSTPISSPIAEEITESPEIAPLPTSTLAVAPTITLSSSSPDQETAVPDTQDENPSENSNLPEIVIGNCPSNINISAPPSGVSVAGDVTVFGSADSENFGYYDLELYGPATGERWISVYDTLQREPLVDDILVTMDLEGFEPGSYLLRLRVVDEGGTEVGQCAIQFEVL